MASIEGAPCLSKSPSIRSQRCVPSRFYTRKLGVLDQQLLKSSFSLSEARVLYELANRENLAAKEIGIELGLDPGYLSRIIQNFDENGLISRKPLPSAGGNTGSV